MAVAYLGIGSNLGDRRKNIRLAVRKIGSLKDTKVIKTSSLIQTNPVGGPSGQGRYLNGALKIATGLSPRCLLRQLKKIEKELGRIDTVRNAARPIDLDILFYDNKVICSQKLAIPHPRIGKRDFVLNPLIEIW